MYIPDYLFYDSKGVKTTYTSDPTGNPDVPRALNREPNYWIEENIASTRQIKTIVLNDFRFQTQSLDQLKALNKMILSLQKEGFNVYLSKDDDCQLLSENLNRDFMSELERGKCKPKSKEQIYDTMGTKGKSKDSVAILSIADLKVLDFEIRNNKTLPRSGDILNISDIISSPYTFEEILSSEDPKVRIYSDVYSPEAKAMCHRISNNGYTIHPVYHTFVIKTPEDVEEYFKHTNSISNLVIYGSAKHYIRDILAKGIRVQNLSLCGFTDEFLAYLELPRGVIFNNIQKIYVDENLKDHKVVFRNNFPHITHVGDYNPNLIKQVTPASSEVQLILPYTDEDQEYGYRTESRVLKITDKKKPSEEYQGCSFEKPELKSEYALSSSDYAPSNIQVDTLEIANDNLVYIDWNILQESYPEISSLSIHDFYGVISANEVDQPLNRLQQSISKNNTNAPAKVKEIKPLEHLKCLVVSDKQIPENSLNFLLENRIAPNLESLTLKSFSISIWSQAFNKLSNLRYLSLETNKYNNILMFRNLLVKLPLLETLNFKGYTRDFVYGHRDPALPDKLKLQHLSIEETHENPLKYIMSNPEKYLPKINHSLIEIISKSDELRDIKLKGFINVDSLFISLMRSKIRLNTLQIVDLSCTDISLEGYKALLKIAPHLKKLSLRDCPYFTLGTEPVPHTLCFSNEISTPEISQDSKLSASSSSQQTVALPPSSKIQNGDLKNRSSYTVKKDTKKDNLVFNIKSIFKNIDPNGNDPDPTLYRLSVFNKIEFSHDPENPFEFTNDRPRQLDYRTDYIYGKEAIQQTIDSNKNGVIPTFAARHSITLTNEFQALPSLDAAEKLLALNVSDHHRDDIEIAYCSRDNLYYIRSNTDTEQYVDIDFIIQIPPRPKIKLQPDVEKYFAEFSKCKAGDLPAHLQSSTGSELLNAWRREKLGACDQRSTMFKHFMESETQSPPNIRIIENDAHALIEVFQENHWLKLNLGGIECQLNIKEDNDLLTTITQPPPNPILMKASVPMEQKIEFSSVHLKHKSWESHEICETTPEGLAIQALNKIKVDSKSGERLGQNVLIKCSDDFSVTEQLLTIEYVAKESGRNVFVIDSPDQIACAIRWLKRDMDNNQGEPCPPPGGALYQFIKQCEAQPSKKSVIIINWNNFSSDELVRYNSIIDKNRLADGIDLPKQMVVVGLYNTLKPGAYSGSDFYSRNTVKLDNNIPLEDIKAFNRRFDVSIPTAKSPSVNKRESVPAEERAETTEDQPGDIEEIDLYEDVNWKTILLGQWTVEKGKFRFEEGPLAKALKQGRGVHLNNPPWHLESFQRFWREAKIHGSIPTEGEDLPVDANFWTNLTYSRGYDWKHLTHNIHFVQDAQDLQDPIPINPETMRLFLDHYELEANHFSLKNSAFQTLFAKATPGKPIDLMITRDLSLAAWSKLLNEAQIFLKSYSVQLRLAVPDGVTIPQEILDQVKVPKMKNRLPICPEHKILFERTTLIETNEISQTVNSIKQLLASSDQSVIHYKTNSSLITKNLSDPIIIDISDSKPTDLFYQLRADLSSQDFKFYEHFTELWEALESGHSIILKGQFSPAMIDNLSTMCMNPSMLYVNGKSHSFKGRLILVSDKPLSPAFEPISISEKLIEKPKDLLQGITSLPSKPDLNLPIKDYDLSDDHVETVADLFIHQRISSLYSILADNPYAFISGQTGIGKSTFVEKYLTPDKGFMLYNEMSQFEAWAEDKTPGNVKVLFLDEANISDDNYSLFEGLYEIPPTLFYKGKLYVLTPEHSVVLAGNPLSYGGERKLPSLLANHGSACIFEPLPPEVIFKELLKPIFKEGGLAEIAYKQYSQIILKSYQTICALSKESVLISPRELKMMAMMIVANSKTKTLDNNTIQDIVYQVAEQGLPKTIKPTFSSWYNSQYPEYQLHKKFPEAAIIGPNQFVLTESRAPIYESMMQLLAVRNLTMTNGDNALKSAGLGGMVLEGMPGTGKSHFLLDVLQANDYKPLKLPNIPDKSKEPLTLKEGRNKTPPLSNPNSFYYIPASLSFEEKKKVLLLAFHQGAMVVIDEINSGPMMEQLLNSLLMGVHPDSKEGPDNTGFLLLATQNPASMEGREAISNALRRRLLLFEFSNYPPHEMKLVLTVTFPSVPEVKIDKHIREHFKAVQYAKQNKISPLPVFRDLYKIIEAKHMAIMNAAHAAETTESMHDDNDVEPTRKRANSITFMEDSTRKAPASKSPTQSVSNKLSGIKKVN